MISKKYLLFLAGIVWSIAGYNVLHIGLQSYTEYLSPILFFASAIVFLFFQFMIFGKLVKVVVSDKNRKIWRYTSASLDTLSLIHISEPTRL